VLIDTAGADPRRALEAAQIASLAAACEGRLVAVLPAGMDAEEAREMAEALRDLRAAALIVTRLDQTRRLAALECSAQVLGLAALGVGPGAADGLVPASAARLPALLLSLLDDNRRPA
jgi:flagellar biosynthesis GTPase FlhF